MRLRFTHRIKSVYLAKIVSIWQCFQNNLILAKPSQQIWCLTSASNSRGHIPKPLTSISWRRRAQSLLLLWHLLRAAKCVQAECVTLQTSGGSRIMVRGSQRSFDPRGGPEPKKLLQNRRGVPSNCLKTACFWKNLGGKVGAPWIHWCKRIFLAQAFCHTHVAEVVPLPIRPAAGLSQVRLAHLTVQVLRAHCNCREKEGSMQFCYGDYGPWKYHFFQVLGKNRCQFLGFGPEFPISLHNTGLKRKPPPPKKSAWCVLTTIRELHCQLH